MGAESEPSNDLRRTRSSEQEGDTAVYPSSGHRGGVKPYYCLSELYYLWRWVLPLGEASSPLVVELFPFFLRWQGHSIYTGLGLSLWREGLPQVAQTEKETTPVYQAVGPCRLITKAFKPAWESHDPWRAKLHDDVTR